MIAVVKSRKINIYKLTSLIGLFILCIFAMTLFPKEAMAHAYVAKSTPAENEIFTTAPTNIFIQFNESIQPGFHSIIILDSRGKKMPLNKEYVNSNNETILEAKIKGKLPNGTYTMQWKAVSADGHPVQGVIPFSIGTTQDSSSIVKAETSNYIPKADMIFLRWLLFSSFALYIGGIMYNLFICRAEQDEAFMNNRSLSTKMIWLALVVMFICILLNLPLQTKVGAGVSWLEAFKPNLLTETLTQTTFGSIWIVQIFCIIGLLIATYFANRTKSIFSYKDWAISLLFFIAILITKSLTSHAAVSTNKIMAVSMDFLHLLAASIWVGTLFYLAFLLPKRQKTWINESEKNKYWYSINRFSLVAIGATAIILLTGIYGSLEYVPTFYALLHTYYGIALIGKILLFIIMLFLGSFHYIKGRKHGNKDLTRTIIFEFGIGLVVMVVAALLTNLPTSISSPGPFKQTMILDNKDTATLQISPNIAGINSFKIVLKDQKGKPITDVEKVQLTFTPFNTKLDASSIDVPEHMQGVFQTKGMYINIAGDWKVTVHVLTTSLDSYDIDFNPVVGSQ
ncbi:copper resistance protein CopC [Lysinibacillus sp. NPDC093210]|uniref:copper resistance protein CopC n=1 Tax=Lysinibacillus sp. NPDC093210 TaxID=3364133 RepID=UPI0037F4BE5B